MKVLHTKSFLDSCFIKVEVYWKFFTWLQVICLLDIEGQVFILPRYRNPSGHQYLYRAGLEWFTSLPSTEVFLLVNYFLFTSRNKRTMRIEALSINWLKTLQHMLGILLLTDSVQVCRFWSSTTQNLKT